MDVMLRGMTLRHLQEWRAFADLEPEVFDEQQRADYRAASIVQAIINTAPRKKGAPAVSLSDCLLSFKPAKPRTREQAQAEIRQTMDLLYAVQQQGKKRKR